ncbi:MAG: hypothetical protein KDD15_08775 [Lewinella sp.]|nr:hypothetical protein [Lewinella sp.]
MKLSQLDISTIRAYLTRNGLETPAVIDDLADHICCSVEEKMRRGQDFPEAFADTIQQFTPEDIREIQESTTYYLTINSKIMLLKGIFISAFLAVFCYVLASVMFNVIMFTGDDGLAYRLQYLLHTLGLFIFCFGFLPFLFRYGYKQFVARIQE